MKRNFPIIIEQDDDGIFIVECPTIKGCRSYGHSIEEAMVNMREAIEACLEPEDTCIYGPRFLGWREIEVAVP